MVDPGVQMKTPPDLRQEALISVVNGNWESGRNAAQGHSANSHHLKQLASVSATKIKVETGQSHKKRLFRVKLRPLFPGGVRNPTTMWGRMLLRRGPKYGRGVGTGPERAFGLPRIINNLCNGFSAVTFTF